MAHFGGNDNCWTRRRERNSLNSDRNSNKKDKKRGSGDALFRETQKKLQNSILKHLENEYESSSDEEELEAENIMGSLLKNYTLLGGTNDDLGRTQNFLENAFQSGAAVCLICIGSVKRVESIWSCDSCYGFFHLFCIQRWAKDSIAHQKLLAEDTQKKGVTFNWQCPKCRKDYKADSIPNHYLCFCGNKLNPEFHPWLIPHSCGDTCNKPLEPKCGHDCLLLCHPGPCPPCPKMVKSQCFCKKSPSKTVRCSKKERSCGGICGRKLKCDKHSCPEICHSGDCPPCKEQSLVACQCRLNKKLTDCAQYSWQCDKVCGKPYSCGFHSCEKTCHSEDCGCCPKTLPRACPCGHETYVLPCVEEAPTCGGTCGKVLDCGIHTCSQRCHRGPCGNCMEVLIKSCRCGLHKKEVPCQKEYLCETKCKGLRDCHTHTCNRKCCDGRCPPCEKPCGKTLVCGQHKCTSVCHRGPCYPCQMTKTLTCRCGGTSLTVPCGTSKKRIIIRCNKLCRIPPDCHHSAREDHKCHPGSCPTCKLPCEKSRICGHNCKLPCHSSVVVSAVPDYKPDTPWEKVTAPVEVKSLPCPPCNVLMPVWCPGQHELLQLPCHRAFEQSCGRICGRLLDCSNHHCYLLCHTVINARQLPENLKSEELQEGCGDTCEECSLDCEAERACTHPCPLTCHPPPCPPCTTTIKMRCHCFINSVYIKCSEWTSGDDAFKEQVLSCGNQCPKMYSCGHRCINLCHKGKCSGEELCRKKVKLNCLCKRIKKEVVCHLVSSTSVECDFVCTSQKLDRKMREEKEQEEARRAEEKRNREELEKYEKKLQGGKRHRTKRRTINEEDDSSFWIRNKFTIFGLILSIIISTSLFYAFKL
ncbi:NF-X1-type zinc finger protein NFXL1 [Rhodnius prolixus]|uniref:NF-X1-type zinc finger protein NFXL1 n=1 Tax=Rhodnius prolixus TaxID=13249 RepID=UPI003D189962